MNIVINMPDSTTKEMLENYESGSMLDQVLRGALKQAIILPKGHGRLIDANELLKMTNSYKSELGRLKADPFVKLGIETVENFIRDLPTIIEADKAESEEV